VVGTADRMVSGITEAGRSLIREVGSTVLPPESPRPPSAASREQKSVSPRRPDDIRIDE
jgi:hypothetical protein